MYVAIVAKLMTINASSPGTVTNLRIDTETSPPDLYALRSNPGMNTFNMAVSSSDFYFNIGTNTDIYIGLVHLY